MQIDEPKMTTPVRSTPNLHRGGGGGSGGGGSPPAKMSVSGTGLCRHYFDNAPSALRKG